MDEEQLSGGRANAGAVVRIGDTVRRPRGLGAPVVEALLSHLEHVGFPAAPRFLGVDELGRQVLSFVDGDVHREPPWQLDDEANAFQLGQLAGLLRRLHDATASFVPPADCRPLRPLPLHGTTWTHGDPGYPNVVYRGSSAVAFIDWEFAAPGDPICDPAALLALCTRGARPDVADSERRAAATAIALDAIADGYGMSDAQRHSLPLAAAAVLEDTVEHWRATGAATAVLWRTSWRAAWFRAQGERLSGE